MSSPGPPFFPSPQAGERERERERERGKNREPGNKVEEKQQSKIKPKSTP